MTKPTTNLERLEAIRRGLDKILEKHKREQERWLEALGGIKETALADYQIAAGIAQVEGMLSALDTVIKTDYSPSAETANGVTPPGGSVVDGEGNFKCVPPDGTYAEARRRLGKAMGLPDAHPDITQKLGGWMRGEAELPENVLKTLDPEDKAGRFPLFAQLAATGKLTYQEAVKAAREACNCGAPECPVCSLIPPGDMREKTYPVEFKLGELFKGEKEVSENLGDMLRREGIGENEPFVMRVETGEPLIDETLAGGIKRGKETRENLHVPHEINDRFKLPDSWPDDFRREVIAKLMRIMQSEGEEKARGWFDGLFPGYDFNTEFSFQKLAAEQPDIMVPFNKREPAPEDIETSPLKHRMKTGHIEYHPGLLVPPFDDAEVESESQRRATEIENELAQAAQEGKEIVKVDQMGNREIILPADSELQERAREQAIERKLDRVKRGARGEHVEPETLEDAVALRGPGVKDRIAATEAEAMLRMGSGDMVRKHTAEDTQAVRLFVYRALELPWHRRIKCFQLLGLLTQKEATLSDLETIKIAFRKAREGGRESMEALIQEVNKLHNEIDSYGA